MTAATALGFAILAVAVTLNAAAGQAQICDGRTEQRLDQETYLALTDRVYVHAPDIESLGASGGWRAFELRVLVGTYRPPLLLPRGVLKPNDLQKLLTTRPDIRVLPLRVNGHDPAAGGAPTVSAAVAVDDGERPRRMTIRATRVVPVNGGTDHMFLVCTPGG